MQSRRLGDATVSAIGLGGMPLSLPRPATGTLPDRDEAIATVHAAVDAGVTLIDTADCYAPDGAGLGHNEELIADALRSAGHPDVLVATKGGVRRDGPDWPPCGRPDWIRAALEGSLRRLRTGVLDLYQHHQPDPDVAYAETIGAFKDAHDAGLVARVGISNVDRDQIREAHEILGAALVSVQNRYSPAYVDSGGELDLCEELGLAFLPWSPLGGIRHASELASTFAPFATVAEEVSEPGRRVSPHQVVLAWMLARSPVLIPIPGASRPASVRDGAQAWEIELTEDQRARLDACCW